MGLPWRAGEAWKKYRLEKYGPSLDELEDLPGYHTLTNTLGSRLLIVSGWNTGLTKDSKYADKMVGETIEKLGKKQGMTFVRHREWRTFDEGMAALSRDMRLKAARDLKYYSNG